MVGQFIFCFLFSPFHLYELVIYDDLILIYDIAMTGIECEDAVVA